MKLKEMGVSVKGVTGVYPTVTYPSHTTMVTGVMPDVHGITSNRIADPYGTNFKGWFWYEEDIKSPTIWSLAKDNGKRVALLNWPVTVGAQVDYLVPEYWRAGTSDDLKLYRALSTPGLLEEVAASNQNFWKRFQPPEIEDSATVDVAVHIINKKAPHLMLVHIWMVDHMQHEKGPGSVEAIANIEEADKQIARIIQACKDKGIWDQTYLFVVSDHGFLPIQKKVNVGAILREQGLVKFDKDKKIVEVKAYAVTNGGSAYIYLHEEKRSAEEMAQLEKQTTEIFTTLANTPNSGIAKVLSKNEIRERRGDAQAFLGLTAADGISFSSSFDGTNAPRATTTRGHHGFDESRQEMKSSLLLVGPGIKQTVLEDAHLMDVGKTVTKILSLPSTQMAGSVLKGVK